MRNVINIFYIASFLIGCGGAGIPEREERLSSPPTDNSISIGIIGDQTGAVKIDDSYKVLQDGVNALRQEKLDVIIHMGDLIESTKTEIEISQDFRAATGILSQLPSQWYLTAGDHDVNPVKYEQDSSDRSRETLFKKLYSTINPKVKDNLYYSFDIKGYHFVALYALEHLHTDPRWGNVYFSQISDAQYEWLKKDLSSAADSNGIIVFVHQPIWYNWSGWSRVHELLKQYPAASVIAGHFHYNQYEGILDGIDYRVMGSTGGDTKNGTPNAGNIYHVTVLSALGKKVYYKPLPLSKPSMTFTSRYVMDRIQATSQILGNLYSFGSANPIYLKGNKIVNDCSKDDPARLTLTGLGNPTELKMMMKLSLLSDSPSIILTSGKFADGYCINDIAPYKCRMNASQWIGMSNNSTVQMAYGKETESLWNGTIGINGDIPKVPQDVRLHIELSFTDGSKNENYMIYGEGVTTLKPCNQIQRK